MRWQVDKTGLHGDRKMAGVGWGVAWDFISWPIPDVSIEINYKFQLVPVMNFYFIGVINGGGWRWGLGATNFLTWCDSCAVVACAKLCCNLMASYGIIVSRIPSDLNCKQNIVSETTPHAHSWPFWFVLWRGGRVTQEQKLPSVIHKMNEDSWMFIEDACDVLTYHECVRIKLTRVKDVFLKLIRMPCWRVDSRSILPICGPGGEVNTG